jgi:predicted dehydrogenase
MPIKIAFMGFRHAHIFDLYRRSGEWDEYEVVAACEEDAEARKQLAESGRANITHDSYEKMLDDVECDAVAIGDYYGKRGAIAIEALSRGKHVISDKPLCTSLNELSKIKALSEEKALKVGLMLDLRDQGVYIRIRELVRSGAIGDVHSIAIGGQHPLLLGTRPGWYFEVGKHGGTINDIGIHAFDIIPWITGLQFSKVTSARAWNAFAPEFPHFRDGGQFMVEMENGGGVMGDVSYFMPDSTGYSLPMYWRITLFGRDGIIEAAAHSTDILLAKNGNKEPEAIGQSENIPGGYLRSFTEEVTAGQSSGLSTADVLRASYVSLMVQKAADEDLSRVRL